MQGLKLRFLGCQSDSHFGTENRILRLVASGWLSISGHWNYTNNNFVFQPNWFQIKIKAADQQVGYFLPFCCFWVKNRFPFIYLLQHVIVNSYNQCEALLPCYWNEKCCMALAWCKQHEDLLIALTEQAFSQEKV